MAWRGRKAVLAAPRAVRFPAPGAKADGCGWGCSWGGGWGWGGHANDTGGIIPWTPETATTYRVMAAEQCARWNKLAVITRVHRVYGDYVGDAVPFPPPSPPTHAPFSLHPLPASSNT